MEKALSGEKVDTIVFIPDKLLRTIPVSALNGGNVFLVERYALATSPGWRLIEPHPHRKEDMELLVSGLTEAVQGFAPLENVSDEFNAVRGVYRGNKLLKDRDFSISNLKKELELRPYQVVHIASHGEFTNGVDDTFVLTWDGRMTLDDLKRLMSISRYRREPVELLTPSACRTAAGDDRAALGLAGVAIKSGARSALASLWYINDQASSELIADFYGNMKTGSATKARSSGGAKEAFGGQSFQAPLLLGAVPAYRELAMSKALGALKRMRPAASGVALGVLVSAAVVLIRGYGFLESVELIFYDRCLVANASLNEGSGTGRPPVVIVAVTEEDIQRMRRWPLADGDLAALIEKTAALHPAAIGLDIFRDFPVPPGGRALRETFSRHWNIVAIEKIGGDGAARVPRPYVSNPDLVGFNDVLQDRDGIIRRGLLFLDGGGGTKYSFSLLLSLIYLNDKGIAPEAAAEDGFFRIGKAVFAPLEADDGPYVGVDARGYQFLLDYYDFDSPMETYSLADVLGNRVPRGAVDGRIVIIGSTARIRWSGGVVFRPPSKGLAATLANADKRGAPGIYADNGVWYDSFSSLMSLMEKEPGDAALKGQLDDILRQAGIELPQGK
ncbi:MAG: CHAT domain-containing protein [Deltaproteobacteria bacterium]|nr:CHAT domain-containing protein [Deltaproteobacteria bacterium]